MPARGQDIGLSRNAFRKKDWDMDIVLLHLELSLNFSRHIRHGRVLTDIGLWSRIHEIQIGVSRKAGCPWKPWTFQKRINNWNWCSEIYHFSNIGHPPGPCYITVRPAAHITPGRWPLTSSTSRQLSRAHLPPPTRTLLRLRSLCRVQMGTWQCFGPWFNRPAHGGAGGGKSRGDTKLCPPGRRFLSHKYTFLALRPKVQGACPWHAIIRKDSLKTDQLAYLVRSQPFSPPSYCPNLRCWVSSATDCT